MFLAVSLFHHYWQKTVTISNCRPLPTSLSKGTVSVYQRGFFHLQVIENINLPKQKKNKKKRGFFNLQIKKKKNGPKKKKKKKKKKSTEDKNEPKMAFTGSLLELKGARVFWLQRSDGSLPRWPCCEVPCGGRMVTSNSGLKSFQLEK